MEVRNVCGVGKKDQARERHVHLMKISTRRPTASWASRRELGKLARAPRHWRRRLLLMVIGVLLILWVLPIGLAYSPLRNQPLALALPGINGTIVSGSASFGWFAPIVYNNVEVRDTAGNVVLSVAAIRSEKPLVYLATHPRSIGGLRLEQPVANLEVRPDGSNLEDVFAPLLKSDGTSGGGIGHDAAALSTARSCAARRGGRQAGRASSSAKTLLGGSGA